MKRQFDSVIGLVKMKDDSLDIVKENYFAHAKCAFCGSTDKLEIDLVNPLSWPNPDMWSWPVWKREGYIREECQVLCGVCFRRKKSLWKKHRLANESWYQEFCRQM